MEKCYIISTNGVVCNEVYSTLKDACDNLGVSYQMAIRGKREFKRGLITDAKIEKSFAKVMQGRKLYKTRLNNVGDTN